MTQFCFVSSADNNSSICKMSVNELEEGEILDDSLVNSDDEGEVKEVSHIDIFSI